ncbi:MAG: hypothetical protein M1830_000972 [Pleopsidium flavum]|nr:MAG: hypothetical protein M1830_000972 [Pleopsidium flavum]
MAVFGLSHTRNNKVGNDFVRGVSGGERKRVSIAEMALSGCPIACWDNSTRGLDAATALEFVKSLRMSSNVFGVSHAVAIYQALQQIYEVFDKAIVLYEGRQTYFGSTRTAEACFENMGWYCPPLQTTGDFLTSVTNPQERKARDGFEGQVPRTPTEFEAYWRQSQEYTAVQKEIQGHEIDFPIGGRAINEFQKSHRAMQAEHMRKKSPYTYSDANQKVYRSGVPEALERQRSVFYNTPSTTGAFFSKGGTLFFAILLNALIAITKINNLYDQRPIVEKQASCAFYHPFTEALAGSVSDTPVKFTIAVAFNIILYFMAGLRREPSRFFIFFLFNFTAMLTMSVIFRTIAASTKTISQALAIAGVLVLAIVIYTGFTIPRPYMHPWVKWISWINPVAYAFEALLVNEVHGRNFPCATLVPAHPNSGAAFVCSVPGSVPGETFVSGDALVEASYQYSYSHIWRNLGFLFAFLIFFLVVYLVATELSSSTSSTAEMLVFRRGHVPKHIEQAEKIAMYKDEESGSRQAATVQDGTRVEGVGIIPPQNDVFAWKDIVYDITIKGEPRRLLDHVSGTSLLNCLGGRGDVGIITGDMLVNGKFLDDSFQRKTGYVQQEDLHLETTTVREALRFSAMLRQPKSVSKKEKYGFVEDVIKMLNMENFAEAVVRRPGEGLNVEQCKLLTIGVELAAKPALLLFLDEPTSGLDSQSSWAIVAFLPRLADSGQAVLSTIHQPSSVLFQEFDRLLFLAKGGKTVYFGDIGHNSETLVDYFQSHGARRCGESENPAESMLEIVGAGASGKSTQHWHKVWKGSQ